MAKQIYEFELDRSALSPEAFSLIKNDLIKDVIKGSWNPKLGNPHPTPVSPGPIGGDPILDDNAAAFHVKAEFSKHVKGGVSVGKFGDNWDFDPGKFDQNSGAIERLKVTIEDAEGL